MRVAANSNPRFLAQAICNQFAEAGPDGEVVIDSVGKKSLYTTIKAAIYANENITNIPGAPEGKQVGLCVSQEQTPGPDGTTIFLHRHHLLYASAPPTDSPTAPPVEAWGQINPGKVAGAIWGRIKQEGVAVVHVFGETVKDVVRSVLVAEQYQKKEGKVGRFVAVPSFASREGKRKGKNGTAVNLTMLQLRYVLA